MKKNILQTLIAICIGLISYTNSYSQDAHLSQYDAAPLYFNPAQAGLFDCDHRMILNYKSQWSVYKTFLASFDQPIPDLSYKGGTFGAGALIASDYGGENSYGNTFLKLMPAYHKTLIPNKLKLSVGLDIMMNLMTIDESTIRLPGQIDPITGNSSGGTEFDNPTKFYADLGLGINAEYTLKKDIPIHGGITIYRLAGSGGGGVATNNTTPNYRRFSLNANSIVPLNSTITLLPSFIFLNQKIYNQMNAGSFVRFSMHDITPIVKALYAGAWYRFGDAFIIGLGFDKQLNEKIKMNLGVSYDVTISRFRTSDNWIHTNNVGTDSFEISVKFINCRKEIIVNPQGIINDPFR
ncbi:MAG: PorP/SprF family type IX secretion system membrane protein [Bacteroidales bacterium]